MEELIIQNEWWEKGCISKEKAKPYRRSVYNEIRDAFFKYRQITVLTGLRRVGKSTIAYQLIEELLNRNVKPEHIIYFSFDKKIDDLIKILKLYQKITKINWKREKIYLFLDEIQKLKGWSSKLKLIYDNLPNIKICITCSASLMIKKQVLKDLAGRYFKFEIKPLTLREYAELYYGKKIDNFELFSMEIESLFEDYIRKPFPEIVKVNDWDRIYDYIKSIIVEKIIGSDIPAVFKRVNINLLTTLTEIFFRNPGMILNTDKLSKKLHVHKLTLKEHLYYLEFGKLIRIVKNFRPSVMAESRKLPKIYPYHPSFSFAYFAEAEKGKIFENLVMHRLDLFNYFKDAYHEVDFLKRNKKIIPVEVKAKENISKNDIKNLLLFMKKFGLNESMVVYSGSEREIKIDNLKVKMIPLMKLLFE